MSARLAVLVGGRRYPSGLKGGLAQHGKKNSMPFLLGAESWIIHIGRDSVMTSNDVL
jgi:hypothetical protein